MNDTAPVLVAEGLEKSFFGVTVLRGVGLALRPGEVHGLVGENGAGKSTFMKILAGVYERDAGTISLGGREVDFSHPVQAARAGLATVFQEFNLLPERTVAQNVFLGREPRKGGFVDRKAMVRETQALLDELGIEGVDPDAPVRTLTVAEQQIVEIVKALSVDARVIQMDEPTAALADHEVELLYAIVRRLSERGVAILYVSHRLKEIFDLCDTITVLKDGALVSAGPPLSSTPTNSCAAWWGGRSRRTSPMPWRAPCSASRGSNCAAPATGTSMTSISSCGRARSSGSRGCRARGAPSSSKRSSAWCRSRAARCCSMARPCA
jgi:ribose transport system ATP-binding protein